MGWFDDSSDNAQAYEQARTPSRTTECPSLTCRPQVNSAPHKAELSHELLGSAAAFEAAKAWENHCAANGKPDSHAKAKEFMYAPPSDRRSARAHRSHSAAAAGGFIDRMVETKGLDFVDREKAKHHAQKEAEEQLQNEY
jgi:hypothetical protein